MTPKVPSVPNLGEEGGGEPSHARGCKFLHQLISESVAKGFSLTTHRRGLQFDTVCILHAEQLKNMLW